MGGVAGTANKIDDKVWTKSEPTVLHAFVELTNQGMGDYEVRALHGLLV